MSARANRPDGALTSRCGRPAGTNRRTGRADTTPTLAAGLRHEVRGLKFPHPTLHRGPCVSTPKQLSPCMKPPAARRRPAATAQLKHNGTSTGGEGGQHQNLRLVKPKGVFFLPVDCGSGRETSVALTCVFFWDAPRRTQCLRWQDSLGFSRIPQDSRGLYIPWVS